MKVRYRGLKKSTAQIITLFALSNALVKKAGHTLCKHRSKFLARLFSIRKIYKLRVVEDAPGIEVGVDD